MNEASYYKEIDGKIVQCQLCPHFCTIQNEELGKCKVRKNVEGKLTTLVFGLPSAVNIDPIEKKPLYHFLPGTRSLSIGTAGCNLSCMHCQNFDLSQNTIDDASAMNLPPEKVIELAKENNVESISYTYNEPTVFIEYMLETAKLAKDEGIKNVIVSNGFTNPEPLNEMSKFIDAANIDIKSFSESFYKYICGASLAPVLKSIKTLHEAGVWLELTTLLIPKKNDSPKEIEQISKWILDNLSEDTPFHLSRFMPMYKMKNIEATPKKTLLKAKGIAEKHLRYVYLGNISTETGSNTYCPVCKTLLIERDYYNIKKLIVGKECKCGHAFDGIL